MVAQTGLKEEVTLQVVPEHCPPWGSCQDDLERSSQDPSGDGGVKAQKHQVLMSLQCPKSFLGSKEGWGDEVSKATGIEVIAMPKIIPGIQGGMGV